MLIQVVYPGDKYDFVKDFMLDNLIDEKKIVRFRRRSGWATVGVDPIRTKKHDSVYFHPERRASRMHIPADAEWINYKRV